MPELPEVETFVNHLKNKIINKKIIKTELYLDKLLKNCDYNFFAKTLEKHKFINLTRKGKYIIFHLDNDWIMLMHLRMEGKPFYEHVNDPYDPKHVLLIIKFDDDHELRYHDTRRFGTVHLYKKSEYLNSKELSKLAKEPIEKGFDESYLKNSLLKSPNKAVKTVILDQTKISGIGNIYADEILFWSKLHPETLVKQLKENDFNNLAIYSKQVLNEAIKCFGTTILSYKYKHGENGSYQHKLRVHIRKNLPCFDCNSLIEKIKVNGRGTYYCPKCQIKKVKNVL